MVQTILFDLAAILIRALKEGAENLTRRLAGFEILNKATLIFQDGLFLGILQISFIN